MTLPAVIVDAGPVAVERFLEFFAASISNGRTRAAYGRAVGRFLSWCAARGLGLRAIAPLHVAAHIRTHPGSAPTVKQHLAAIRVLCDWLVIHQVLPVNPAAAVRGPKHVVTKGATPVLTPAETRSLLDGIDAGSLVGLRDRALLSVMVYSFARVSAVVGMRRQDYFLQGTRGWLRLHEKGGKRHDVPAHHRAEAAVDAYLVAGGIEDVKAPLFQSVDRSRRLSGRSLTRRVVLAMIKPPCSGGGSAGVDVLPHVPGDGHHGVSVERGDAGARAADCRPCVSEDDEAVRPDGGHGDARRDRAHRDLTGRERADVGGTPGGHVVVAGAARFDEAFALHPVHRLPARPCAFQEGRGRWSGRISPDRRNESMSLPMVETQLGDDASRPAGRRRRGADSVPAGPTVSEGITQIRKGVVLQGEVKGGEDIVIDGQVDGTIELPQHVLTVGTTGRGRGGAVGEDGRGSRQGGGNIRASELGAYRRDRLGRRCGLGSAGGHGRRGRSCRAAWTCNAAPDPQSGW